MVNENSHYIIEMRFYVILLLKIILFLAVLGLLLPGLFSGSCEWRLLSSCGACVSHCGGFSCYRAQALEHIGSVVEASGL